MRIHLFLLLCLGLPAALTAHAGTLLELETRSARSGDLPEMGKVWIDGDRLRMESTPPGATVPTQAVIFRGETQELWQLDLSRRRYTHIDHEQLEAIGEQLATARRLAETRLSGLPPEQRALVERMLGLSEPRGDVKEEVRKTDEQESVGGRPCRKAILLRDGNPRGEACVASWKAIGISRFQFRVFRQLGDFQDALRAAIGSLPTGNLASSQPFRLFDELGGFPLRLRRLDAGAVRTETLFTTFEEQDVSPARFEVPADFSEQPLPTGAR